MTGFASIQHPVQKWVLRTAISINVHLTELSAYNETERREYKQMGVERYLDRDMYEQVL